MNTKITFHFILADNDVDGDNEAFTNAALEEICKLCIGHYGLFDGTEVKAKITNASIMDSCGVTKDGRRKRFIYAEAEFPNNEHGRKLISKILLEKPIASIACLVLNRDKVADGVTMISNVTNFYEFSLRFDEEKETIDKNELERRLEAAEKQSLGLLDEIKDLKAQLAEMQDETEIPDIPVFHENETYWRMYPTLEHIKSSVFHSDYDGECYNLFHTKEYADEFAKKCKLIAMMLHCKWYVDSGYVESWDDDGDEIWKYFVYYSHKIKAFKVDSTLWYDDNNVYFSTEENAQKCADWLNKHWKENENER